MPNHTAYSVSALRDTRINSKSAVSSKKIVLRELLLIDWHDTELFQEYIFNGADRNFKFKNPKYGTLTYAQLSQP